MKEYELQKKIITHLRWCHGDVVSAYIHNNPKSGRHGAHLSAMGMIAGIPDLVHIRANGLTLWHEVKTEDGRLSLPQRSFHQQLEELDHEVMTTYGLDDALAQLKKRGVIR